MSKDTTPTNNPPEIIVGLISEEAQYLEKLTEDIQGQGLSLMTILHERSKRETLSAKSAEHLKLLVEQAKMIGGIMKATRKGIAEK